MHKISCLYIHTYTSGGDIQHQHKLWHTQTRANMHMIFNNYVSCTHARIFVYSVTRTARMEALFKVSDFQRLHASTTTQEREIERAKEKEVEICFQQFVAH